MALWLYLKDVVVLLVLCKCLTCEQNYDLLESIKLSKQNPEEVNEFLGSVLKHKNDFSWIRNAARARYNHQNSVQARLRNRLPYSYKRREPLPNNFDGIFNYKNKRQLSQPNYLNVRNNVYPQEMGDATETRNSRDNYRRINKYRNRNMRQNRFKRSLVDFENHRSKNVKVSPRSESGRLKSYYNKYYFSGGSNGLRVHRNIGNKLDDGGNLPSMVLDFTDKVPDCNLVASVVASPLTADNFKARSYLRRVNRKASQTTSRISTASPPGPEFYFTASKPVLGLHKIDNEATKFNTTTKQASATIVSSRAAKTTEPVISLSSMPTTTTIAPIFTQPIIKIASYLDMTSSISGVWSGSVWGSPVWPISSPLPLKGKRSIDVNIIDSEGAIKDLKTDRKTNSIFLTLNRDDVSDIGGDHQGDRKIAIHFADDEKKQMFKTYSNYKSAENDDRRTFNNKKMGELEDEGEYHQKREKVNVNTLKKMAEISSDPELGGKKRFYLRKASDKFTANEDIGTAAMEQALMKNLVSSEKSLQVDGSQPISSPYSNNQKILNKKVDQNYASVEEANSEEPSTKFAQPIEKSFDDTLHFQKESINHALGSQKYEFVPIKNDLKNLPRKVAQEVKMVLDGTSDLTNPDVQVMNRNDQKNLEKVGLNSYMDQPVERNIDKIILIGDDLKNFKVSESNKPDGKVVVISDKDATDESMVLGDSNAQVGSSNNKTEGGDTMGGGGDNCSASTEDNIGTETSSNPGQEPESSSSTFEPHGGETSSSLDKPGLQKQTMTGVEAPENSQSPQQANKFAQQDLQEPSLNANAQNGQSINEMTNNQPANGESSNCGTSENNLNNIQGQSQQQNGQQLSQVPVQNGENNVAQEGVQQQQQMQGKGQAYNVKMAPTNQDQRVNLFKGGELNEKGGGTKLKAQNLGGPTGATTACSLQANKKNSQNVQNVQILGTGTDSQTGNTHPEIAFGDTTKYEYKSDLREKSAAFIQSRKQKKSTTEKDSGSEDQYAYYYDEIGLHQLEPAKMAEPNEKINTLQEETAPTSAIEQRMLAEQDDETTPIVFDINVKKRKMPMSFLDRFNGNFKVKDSKDMIHLNGRDVQEYSKDSRDYVSGGRYEKSVVEKEGLEDAEVYIGDKELSKRGISSERPLFLDNDMKDDAVLSDEDTLSDLKFQSEDIGKLNEDVYNDFSIESPNQERQARQSYKSRSIKSLADSVLLGDVNSEDVMLRKSLEPLVRKKRSFPEFFDDDNIAFQEGDIHDYPNFDDRQGVRSEGDYGDDEEPAEGIKLSYKKKNTSGIKSSDTSATSPRPFDKRLVYLRLSTMPTLPLTAIVSSPLETDPTTEDHKYHSLTRRPYHFKRIFFKKSVDSQIMTNASSKSPTSKVYYPTTEEMPTTSSIIDLTSIINIYKRLDEVSSQEVLTHEIEKAPEVVGGDSDAKHKKAVSGLSVSTQKIKVKRSRPEDGSSVNVNDVFDKTKEIEIRDVLDDTSEMAHHGPKKNPKLHPPYNKSTLDQYRLIYQAKHFAKNDVKKAPKQLIEIQPEIETVLDDPIARKHISFFGKQVHANGNSNIKRYAIDENMEELDSTQRNLEDFTAQNTLIEGENKRNAEIVERNIFEYPSKFRDDTSIEDYRRKLFNKNKEKLSFENAYDGGQKRSVDSEKSLAQNLKIVETNEKEIKKLQSGVHSRPDQSSKDQLFRKRSIPISTSLDDGEILVGVHGENEKVRRKRFVKNPYKDRSRYWGFGSPRGKKLLRLKTIQHRVKTAAKFRLDNALSMRQTGDAHKKRDDIQDILAAEECNTTAGAVTTHECTTPKVEGTTPTIECTTPIVECTTTTVECTQPTTTECTQPTTTECSTTTTECTTTAPTCTTPSTTQCSTTGPACTTSCQKHKKRPRDELTDLRGMMTGHIILKVIDEVHKKLKESTLKCSFGGVLKNKNSKCDAKGIEKFRKEQAKEASKMSQDMLHDVIEALNRVVCEQVRRRSCVKLSPGQRKFLREITSEQAKQREEIEKSQIDMDSGKFLYPPGCSSENSGAKNKMDNEINKKINLIKKLLAKYNKMSERCKVSVEDVKNYLEEHLAMLEKMKDSGGEGSAEATTLPSFEGCGSGGAPDEVGVRAADSSLPQPMPASTGALMFNKYSGEKVDDSVVEKQLLKLGLGSIHGFYPNFDVNKIVKEMETTTEYPREWKRNLKLSGAVSEEYKKLAKAVEEVRRKRASEEKLGKLFGSKRKSKRSSDELSKVKFESPVVLSLDQ